MSDDRDVAAVHPLRFWTAYELMPDGRHEPKDWVAWQKKGSTSPAVTNEKIVRVQRDGGPLWSALRPYYDAWKAGQDAPISGTPLAVAPFMTAETVEAFRGLHIYSIEDLANAEDAALGRSNIPGARGYRDKARAYRDALANTAPVAEELAALRAEIAELRARDAEEPARRGPGRPRKHPVDVSEEAA